MIGNCILKHNKTLSTSTKLKLPIKVQYSTVQYSTVQYSTVQYSTVQYNTIQYNTVECTYVSKCAAMVAEKPHTAAINFFPLALSTSNSMGRGGPFDRDSML